jgi:hypothetical protein
MASMGRLAWTSLRTSAAPPNAIIWGVRLLRALKAEQLRAEKKAHDATDEGQAIAPLVRNRKFESTSLQRRVVCEPYSASAPSCGRIDRRLPLSNLSQPLPNKLKRAAEPQPRSHTGFL